MERYRTIRAYSAGGVVFRLIPRRPTEDGHAIDQQRAGQHPCDVSIEVALVGRSHPGIWALPKGTPRPGETIEQVAVREEVEKALELTGGRHFLLAPGCSIPPETPAKNLETIRIALS